MPGIGIVGTGISGLHAALLLQQHGVDTTVYAERAADELRAGKLPNTVARFATTRARERALGLQAWDGPEFDCHSLHVVVAGEQPLQFRGRVSRPYSLVDFRVYLPELLDEYERRGGRVVIGPTTAADVVALADRHELVAVASGRETMGELFPRDPQRSPYSSPQRVVMAGLFEGLAWPDPPEISLNVSSGMAEIFHGPFHSFDGLVSNLLFEVVPGGPLQAIASLSYEDDPRGFDAAVLAVVRDHAPLVYERVDPAAFGLTAPRDLLQGAITPTVRRGWAELGGGRFAVALGDAWVVNDPITGQGANLGSQCAEVLARAVLEDLAYDELFCRTLEARMWAEAEPVVAWTNSFLQPPQPHVIDLIVGAATDQAVADAFADNFDDPAGMWRSLATPERTAAFLRRHGSMAGSATAS